MTARRKATPIDVRPSNFLAVAGELGLTTVSYLNEALECNDGVRRWLPRDLIGKDGKSLIVYRPADRSYAIDGWEPWHDGMFGGRYPSILSALHWIRTGIDVRAGRVADFRGA